MDQFCTLNLWSSLENACVAFERFVLKVLAANTWHKTHKNLSALKMGG